MSPAIDKIFQRLERQKQATIAKFLSGSAARIHASPRPGCWSTVEVLDHVVKVEEAWLIAVQKNLSHRGPVLLKERLGALMVNLVMRSPIRIKVPPGAEIVFPDATADPPAVIARWVKVRGEMNKLLMRMPTEKLSCGVFRHPVAGWMTMGGALKFLSAHLSHHGYQLRRLDRGTDRG